MRRMLFFSVITELFHKKSPLSEINLSLQKDAFMDPAKSNSEQSQAHEIRIASLEAKLTTLEKRIVTQNTNESQLQNNKKLILCLKQDFSVPKILKVNKGDNSYFSISSISCDNGDKYEQSLVSSLSCSENRVVLESYEIDPPKQDKPFEGEIQDQYTWSSLL